MPDRIRQLIKRVPPIFLMMDIVGSILLGIGLWLYFGGQNFGPAATFDTATLGLGAIIIGILLMLPFFVVFTRIAWSAIDEVDHSRDRGDL